MEISYVPTPATAGTTCPAPMTRAALLGLRASSGLVKDCDYVITDFTQGTLLSGTQLHLQAVSANELSEKVQVNTLFDNEAWEGTYDLDRNLLLELRDNRNNVARGLNGTEVSNFDWGNTSYTNVVVDNATLILTVGNTAQKTNVTIEKSAVLNLTGFLGAVTNLRVASGATVNLTNANGTWRLSTIEDGASFTATNYSGGGDNYYNKLYAGAVLNISNSSSPVLLRNTDIKNGTVNHIGVTTGALNITSTRFDNGLVNHQPGALALTISGSHFYQNGNLNHSQGTLTLTRTFISNDSNIISGTTAGGSTTISNSLIKDASTINNQSAGTLQVTRVSVASIGSINVVAGSLGSTSVTDTEIHGSSNIQRLATATAGTINILGSTRITAAGFMQLGGTGNVTVTQTTINGSSGIQIPAAYNRNISITRVHGTEVARVNLSGTGAGVTDSINDCNLSRRGTITMSASGAAGNNLNYCAARGLSGSINIVGTSSGQSLQRAEANDASIQINNCTVAMTHDMIQANQAGNISLNNLAVLKPLTYARTETAGSISVTGTVAGSVTQVLARAGGSVNVSGTAGSVTRAEASHGSISVNGGTGHVSITKLMAGTLTTGAFNQVNVLHAAPVSKTCTAANNGRADYLGLVSSVPIV